ncbi:MAG: phosphatidate cytidylyltransferase, partial [Akkermansiaceae bacterium]|nr:phosphatidate cytidylyltransferase [Akkermansiaceae bacterium]
PSPTLLWTIAAIATSLVGGTIVRVIGLRKAEADLRRKRFASLRTWWIIAIVLSAALLAGRPGVCLLLGAASLLAIREYAVLLGIGNERPLLASVYVITVINYLLILFDRAGAYVVFVPLAGLATIAVVQLVREKAKGYVRTTGGLFWGLMVAVYAMSHAAYLFILPAAAGKPAGPAGWFLFLLILTEANDIFQAIVGRAVGAHKRHRIAPVMSPNKTWEGFFGGMAVTVGLAFLLAPWLTTLAGPHGPLDMPASVARWAGPLAAGIVITVTGYLGDINISGLKRDSGAKDSSDMLPGMGGLLDRLDSLTFTAPAFVYFLVWWMS